MALVLLVSLGVSTVIAQDDWHTVETVMVFPETVTTEGWKNINGIGSQDLSAVALYQEFNTQNSMYLDMSKNTAKTPQEHQNTETETDRGSDATHITDNPDSETTVEITDSVIEETEHGVSSDESFDTPSDTTQQDSEIGGISEEVPSEPTVSAESNFSETETETETETVKPEESADDSAAQNEEVSFLKRVTGTFSFAFASVYDTLPFTQESTIVEVPEEEKETLSTTGSETQTFDDKENENDGVLVSTPVNNTDVDTALVEDTTLPELKTEYEEEVLGASTTILSASTTEDTDTNLSIDAVPEVENETDAQNQSSNTNCTGNCSARTIRMSGFGLPIFDSKTSLGGLQLRLSAGAQLKKDSERPVSLEMWYSYDQGKTFANGGSIVIADEVSNSINGGYYLFALPTPDDVATLDSLTIEIRYTDSLDVVKNIFIDGAWVELFTVTAPDMLETPINELLADDGYDERLPQGDTLTLPDGEKIDFAVTDDNSNETLIIKSDKTTYAGLSETTLYFNVTNTSNKADTFTLQTYFPKGVGEVSSIQEWQSNKPRKIVIPEYRPFVYHCEAGWEITNNPTNASLQDISKQLSPESFEEISEGNAEQQSENEAGGTEDNDTSTTTNLQNPDVIFVPEVSPTDVEENEQTDTETNVQTDQPETSPTIEPETQEVFENDSNEETTLPVATDTLPLMQFGTTVSNIVDVMKTVDIVQDVEEEDSEETFICRDTNIIRRCDGITGAGTECRVENVKVEEHQLTQYEPDWTKHEILEGSKPDQRSVLRKTFDFLGFGPKRKDVPEKFEVSNYTQDNYTIEPGETKYFKMEIAFPSLSTGEFWIEAIGDHEYGLLDPFWSSQWQYRMPISIDNTNSSETLEEYQVFLELGSSLTDFWNNVNDDGSDIRFVQETTVGNEDAWYGTGWSDRVPITIQASQVDSDQTDFPVYVNLADLGSNFFNAVRADGGDIRITEADGMTEVPYELVTINTGSNTGELHFKGDISSTVDTTFYLYFGNSDATGYLETDTYGAQNVWNSSFIAVYHLEENASGRGTTGLYQDSTSNAYDADDQLNSTGKSGLLGQGQQVAAQGDANEYILLPSAIVNAKSQLTFSYWMNSSEANNQSLINGGANNEYLFYVTGGGTSLQFFPGSTIGITDISASPTWRHVLISRDTGANQWRAFIDGVEDNNSPSAQSLSTLSIPSNCLVIGLEQDVSCLSSGDTSQHLNATIDEMRFQNIVPANDWVSATFRNQATTTDFYATSTIESFTSTTFSELDFWVQHFSTSTEEADIWVQVDTLPASASSTIYLYYGNSAASSASNEYAPFTYSTSTPLYYVVDGTATGNINVYSLIDNNVVSLDGGVGFPLDEGEMKTFSGYASSSVISALGPISATIDDVNADSLTPISFASTTLAIPTNRNTSQYFIHSPFSNATVNTYIANSGTPDETLALTQGYTGLSNTDAGNNQAVIIESDESVLVYHQESSRDSIVVYPPTTRDLFGVDSNNTQITTLTDNPDPSVYCSSGQSGTVTGVTRGEEQGENTCTQGGEGTGAAVRFANAAYPIAAIQQADSDGSESTAFWPQHEFGTQYFMTTDAAYAAVVCSPRFGTSTIEVQTNTGVTVESATCAPNSELPGKVYFDNGQGGDNLAFSAGYKIVSTNGVPFYVIYEDDEEGNDETNILGSVQARKYTSIGETQYTFGSQEVTIDAQYEQLSFGWYENSTNQTPTSMWPLGEGNFVTEGIAITGQGAVNTGDILRLRMNLEANAATGTIGSTAFKLQYAEAGSGQCSGATTWSDVGAIGSTTAAFNGYNNAALVDGSTLSTTTLASSTVFATYEEENLSAFIPNDINPDEVAEWDWVITNNDATSNSNYCFRMVRSTGLELITYTAYPEVETAGPPLSPTLLAFFDNERTASSSPVVLDFSATDIAGDEIHYQIQVDDDVVFGSPIIDKNSATAFSQFENLNTPSDKTPFDSGARIRFTGATSLIASTTYWWRVRGIDPDGSNTWGEWSTPYSFTTDESVTVSEWHQTTGDQFTTNSITSLSTSTGAVSVSGSSGSMTSTPIDFDDATVGNAWGEFSWNDTETSGNILYQIEYRNGTAWMLIPDSVIAGNSVGNGISPINLLDLDTDTYNEIRLVANFTGTVLSIADWTVTWGQRVETPTLGDPFDNEKVSTTTPTFDFTTTDPQGDALEYEISWSTDVNFTSSSTRNSSISPGFSVGNPYPSGATVTYAMQSGEALTNGTTYWWRVRAKDPFGGDSFSPWSDPDSFTIDTSVSVSTWFQTTAEQFQRGTLSGLSASTTVDSISNDAEIGEYGTVVVTNGSSTEVALQRTYNDPVVVASVRYNRGGADGTQRYARVVDKSIDTFTLLATNYDSSVTGTTMVDYLVVEAGDWTLDDGGSGTRIVADTISVSTVSGRSVPTSPGGTAVSFNPVFSGSPPAVITTVSSNNDPNWVLASTYDGSNTVNGPTTAGFTSFLNLNWVTPISHGSENVDYVAIAQNNGTILGSEFHSIVTGDLISVSPAAVTFSPAFSNTPQVTLTHQGSQDGGDGGYGMVDTSNPTTASTVYVAVEEDGPGNTRNGHVNEIFSVIAFENSSGMLESEAGDGLSGTIISSGIPFSDGTGPKFERALFSASSPSGSTTTLQVQYQTATGSWAFIPDLVIPGNSIGTTSSSIDLTGVDVETYSTIRLLATLTCSAAACPTLSDWTVEWSEGVPVSGTIYEYDRSTPVTSGTVQVAINNTPGNTGSIAGDGTWSINNVTAFDGDVITVWVDGAAEADEAVAVFVYDGAGDMTGVELFEQHLSLSSNENGTTTNALLATYDNSVSGNEDIFFDVDIHNDLAVCATSGCSEANLYVGVGDIFIPDIISSGNVATHDLINNGRIELDGNTVRVSGSWDNNATLLPETSTVIFTATSTAETLDDNDSLLDFQNVTFGENSGTATWQILDPLDSNGALHVSYGTLNRSTVPITLAGNLLTDANGFWSGVGTTTFDGSGSSQWTDNNSVTQNIGRVVIDGSVKTVALQSDVLASSITIGANDTLNGGTANDIRILGDFTNANTFVAGTSRIVVAGAATDSTITTNGNSLYALRASTTGGSIAFTGSTVTLLDNLEIATGTVTLPTTQLNVGGSFSNTGGVFAHNNATVRFTGSGNETIELQGDEFLNHFYDVSFTGSGDWAFVDTNATTTNTFTVTNGTVTLPSGTLTVGRDFTTSGSGAFNANGGEVLLLIEGNDTVTTNGSAFNDVRVRQGSGGGGNWFNDSWEYRLPITIRASAVDANLTNFPVYVDLADLPAAFFSNLNPDGGDIRVTESDGLTEVPREIVAASTTAETGEMYFLATSLSSTTDTMYYMYYGNGAANDYAVTDTYGAENVWSNGYVLVTHMNDLTASTILNSANGSLNGTKASAGNPNETTAGKIYEAQQDNSSDHIAFGNLGGGATNITISAWFNSNNLNPGSGDNDTYGQTIFSAHSSGAYTWLTVGGTGGGGSPSEARFCAFDSSSICDVSTGANLQNNTWHYVSAAAIDGGAATMRVDGSQVASFTSNGGGTWNSGSTIGDLRPNRNIEFDGELDEIRVSNVIRTNEWRDATYLNQATTTDFYTSGTPQQDNARTFASTNVTANGNVVIESGQAVFPTGVFAIGGSFDNNDQFAANGGTVRFNSTSSSETIAPGISPFYNLDFDDLGGVWSIIENATATNAVTLSQANSLTVNAGVTLESTGTFSNQLNNASTTWTGATLLLSGGGDFALNSKTNEGDDYNILTVTGDGDVRMWNSTAATYDTQDTASIYSQDHAGTDGDLYIFGEYVRESGIEYWAYETDFDGTDLTAGSEERQVNVRVANGATVTASSSTLLISGDATASTTVDAQSGSFVLSTEHATVTASFFEMTGTNASGFQLLSSSTVTLLDNARFTIPSVSAAITVDASTIDTNPAAQFFNTNFITGGGNVNVTLSGSPTSFWWFRNGVGDRYGEAFDNADGDPGSIRWDDSNYQIDVSGVVYADDGTSTLGGPTCDGVTANVRIVVNGGAYTDAVPCSGLDGTYSFTNVSYNGDASFVVYLDTNGGVRGSVITRTPTANILDLDVYANRVMTRHEGVEALSINELALYDESNDTDLRFSAATSTLENTLTVRPDTELYVFGTTTFTPDGTVTLQSGGTGNAYDGTLHIGPAATFTGVGTTTYSVGGSIILEPDAALITASSTFSMTATTTGKTITAPTSLAFNELQFTGVGGGWNINTDIFVADDIYVATGTVTGTGDITLTGGSFYGDGLVSLGGGEVILAQANTLGGTQGWTFNDLTLGNGLVVGTTTPAGTATTTVAGILTISAAHYLDAGSSSWNLTGSGNVFVENGTFLEDTSTVQYGGVAGNTVLSTTYYNLVIDADGGSPTFTAEAAGLEILNDLRVGGFADTVFTLTANDPTTAVGGDVFITANGTLVGSDSTELTVSGDWNNDGTFTSSNGLVMFDSTDAFTILAGQSSFGNVLISGAGAATVGEHATSTGYWTFASTSNVTVDSGQRLAIGGSFNNNAAGAATTWTGSTLHLFGAGQYDINTSSTNDEYSTLSAGVGTHIRMWNSSAANYVTAAGGSIYSMDHTDVTGDLYIFGDYVQSSTNDYWSYATDFDGTDLTGGNERQVDVYVENGGSYTLSGGGLAILGTPAATTTVQVQGGSGTYAADVSGGTFSAQYYVLQDMDTNGLTFTGSPTVTTLSNGTFIIGSDNARGMTIAGSVINTNPAKNFVSNVFATTSGVSVAYNASTTGSAISSWRFTTHSGDVDGEAFDLDGTGDPGYLVWDDSIPEITISGYVYENDGATPSSVCGANTNIVLAVDGVVTSAASSTCDGSGYYSITGVSFSPNDTLTLFIDGETAKGATVSTDPISSVGNMNIYENHVIVRHEGTNPLSIADMSVYDSSDDADIPFTAVTGSPDTLTITTGNGLLVWENKEFEPQGNITITGGGSGQQYNGALLLAADAVFTANGTENHTIGGSIAAEPGAVFNPANATTTFTATNGGRLVDINNGEFYNVEFVAGGNWTISDDTFTTNNVRMTVGTLTLPSGTTTVSGNFNKTGGTLTYNNSLLIFDGADSDNRVAFGGSEVGSLQFTGTGGWLMSDTDVIANGSVTITDGTLTLPSGSLSLSSSFRNEGGNVTHNTSELIISTSTNATVLASSSDLYAVTFAGGGTFTMEDTNVALLDDLTITSGDLTLASGTLSIGGSLSASGGTFEHASGTILFNSSDTGETIDPGSSDFYNVNFGSASGGWTVTGHATTTNNFTLGSASSFTQQSGTRLYVGNVFTNTVGGANTTWTGSTLVLDSRNEYTINNKTAGGDSYNILEIGANSDIRAWDSQAVTTIVDPSASFYSQDHGGVAGMLNIYGDFHIGTTTEYWSYATDFDGSALGGSSRSVTVSIAENATTTVDGGSLQIIGTGATTTTIQNQGSGTYAFIVNDGIYNANYYAYRNLNGNGLVLSGTPTITSLSYGDFALAVNGGSMITLSSTTLSANPSKLIYGTRFATTSSVSGYNVHLNATTTNAWSFRDHYGNRDGELFDIDGTDDCGSIRWDDSSCLLVEQTHYRWRNDDGGLGVPNSEWFNASWGKRKRVRIVNNDNTTYATTTVKMTVPYDTDMQSNFEDIRFTRSDGVTAVPYWMETYTASTEATIWITVPSLSANGAYDAYMYYDNVSAVSISSSTDVFIAVDDFEDNGISEYSGDTIKFQTEVASAFAGSYGVGPVTDTDFSADGIARFDQTVSQGEIIRYMQYVDTTSGSADEACTLFGVQSPVTDNNNYAVCLELFGTDRISLVRDAERSDNYGSVVQLATTSVSYTTGWYEVEIDWQTNNTIDVRLYNSAGSSAAAISAVDSTYTSGGLGFTYWSQHGGWDSLTARYRTNSTPSIVFGGEQVSGGTSWNASQDTPSSDFEVGDVARVRFAVENSGLAITNQAFLLEYAPKGSAPSCESVGAIAYNPVPATGSCGSADLCMIDSATYTSGATIADLLTSTNGEYVSGQAIDNTSNITGSLDLGQDTYTEVEYAITSTINASDSAYCLRVTNNGSDLDSYASVAEFTLQFAPTLSTFTLNGGNGISLIPGTTTTVIATGTVTDLNGYSDLMSATTTFYRGGVGAACTEDPNNCYVATSSAQCSFTNCGGNSCDLECTADFYFHADPTDAGPYAGEEWFAFGEVVDTTGFSSFNSSLGVELFTLHALEVSETIDYGALEVYQDTGSYNASTTIMNEGNDGIDVEIVGSDLSDGLSSTIPASEQIFATSSFTYSACTYCTNLDTSATTYELDLSKPTSAVIPITDEIYWGIYVPFGTKSNPHSGVNIFYAISDN